MYGYGFSLIAESGNSKTGDMPVSYQHRETCNKDCPFKDEECLAEHGFIPFHWNKVDRGERGTSWPYFVSDIAQLPRDIWRFGVAGDLPHHNGRISKRAVNELIQANDGREVIAFSHHDHTKWTNILRFKEANEGGFTLNRSFERAKDAVAYTKRYNLPAVTTMPLSSPKSQVIDGVRVVMCPAKPDNDITCKSCRLCAKSKRKCVVGFYPIGKKAKQVDVIARS